MNILGIVNLDNASAALITLGRVVAAAEEEPDGARGGAPHRAGHEEALALMVGCDLVVAEQLPWLGRGLDRLAQPLGQLVGRLAQRGLEAPGETQRGVVLCHRKPFTRMRLRRSWARGTGAADGAPRLTDARNPSQRLDAANAVPNRSAGAALSFCALKLMP